MIHPVVIIGSGAAGMLAAIFAGNAGVPVLLLETRRAPGAKIRVSGGGRCNVLPSVMTLADYHTGGSPNAMRNVLMSWPLEEVKRFFTTDLGIALKVEETGKMFPVSDRSKDVVDALLAAMSRARVTLRGEARVVSLVRDSDSFLLTLEGGETLRAARVVLSGGGLSMPRTGSDGGTWGMAKKLGHTVLPTYAALVPLLTDEHRWHELAGLSLNLELDVRTAGGKSITKRREDFLFTHTGFSGPATLDVSRHFTQPDPAGQLLADWAPDLDWERLLTTPQKRAVVTLVREHLPRRLADMLFERCDIPLERMMSDLSRDERKRLAGELTSCSLVVTGSEGYRTAEVTAGGIPLDELSLKTLESRIAPGLFVCGEMLDVTGRIGGFNFLWAWVTGRRVGLTLGASGVLSPSAA
ncbi:MAG: NAD(P)/FAD-dependent oxidoreductase [Myxococcota bacterium]